VGCCVIYFIYLRLFITCSSYYDQPGSISILQIRDVCMALLLFNHVKNDMIKKKSELEIRCVSHSSLQPLSFKIYLAVTRYFLRGIPQLLAEKHEHLHV